MQHAEVAAWIREGLPLHKGKEKCEFCCNALESSRLKALQAHFSKDVETLEKALIQRKGELRGMKLDSSSFNSNEFYPKIWSCLERDQSELNKLVAPYNDCLDKIIAAIDSKLSDLFQRVLCPKLDTGLLEKIQAAADSINKRIKASNQMTDEFGVRKKEAITKLKRHFAAEFFNVEKLGSDKALTSICQKHLSRYKKIEQKLSADSEKLHAKISKAQKGREELNKLLGQFLVDSNVSSSVVTVGDTDRFRPLRGDVPANNLSEGERTAIAYAFFLVKLKETTDLSDLIVVIDDPISSLDSNHLFQINAVTREFFFHRGEGNEKQLAVKQLFVATHNFEFFRLAKCLPLNDKRKRFYFVKRLGSEEPSLMTLPSSIREHNSECQYLWHVIYEFNSNDRQTSIPELLSLPNAIRRLVELYTYAKYPSGENVNSRAAMLWGYTKSVGVLKLLHDFSHADNLIGTSKKEELLINIRDVAKQLVSLIEEDKLHHKALMDTWEKRKKDLANHFVR